MLHRRQLLSNTLRTTAALTLTTSLFESQRRVQASLSNENEILWHDVQEWGVEGRGFNDTESFYDRLPAKAKSTVRESVWGLSRHSAGMLTRFRTNATSLHVSYEVTSKNLAMPHMPATGVSGLDLYAKDLDGRWKWVAVLPPSNSVVEQQWVSGLTPYHQKNAVYLPLYNGVKYLKIGTPKTAEWEPLLPRSSSPIVFYGTSITQGACATRPGMAHTAILGRRLDRPVINLGFSGSGTMDLAIADLLGEIDAAVYIIDCLPNMTAEDVRQRTVPFISKLRHLRPSTPILLVEDRSYSGSWLISSQKERNVSSRTALAEQMSQLRELKFENLHYLGGESLLGADRDDTTDGSHPSDLGFQRHADAFEPVLRSLLSS